MRTYRVVASSTIFVTFVVDVTVTTLVAVVPLSVFVAGTLAVLGTIERQLQALDKLELASGPVTAARQASEVAGLVARLASMA